MNQAVSVDDILVARYELLRREKVAELQGSLTAFITYFFPLVENIDFIFKDHHNEIIEVLEKVYRCEIDRVIFNIPPSYGKTELVVILFCAWCYAKTNDCRFLHLSYSADLTSDNSQKIKNIINLPEFQELFPMQFRKETNGKERWKTHQNGEFRAASSGGAVTGFRAGRLSDFGTQFTGALIIDDPIKPEDAESDVLRRKMNQRINNTIKSRLADEFTPVILIMQRVHDDDVAGFMLAGNTGDEFIHINIPVFRTNNDGEEVALWEEKDSYEYLKKYQIAAPYEFSSQYMQNPVPDDGVFFQRDQFKWYDLDNVPHGETFGSSDCATTKDAGDFTEHGAFRVTEEGNIYITDWWSGQESADVWIEAQLDLAQFHNIKMWSGETGVIRQSTEPFLKRRMLERKQFMKLEWFSHSEASKEQNARGFQALVSSGRVHLPRGEQWAEDLVAQLCRFPRGKFDDKVDTCSIFAKMINKLWSNKAIQATEELPDPNSIESIIQEHRRAKRTKNNRKRI